MKPLFKFAEAASLLFVVNIFIPDCFGQGSLTPPGAPAPAMKTLDQIEPRTPLNTNNTPGNATYEFIITKPGSYYFTTNVTGADGKYGLYIGAPSVTVDFMGYELVGATNSFEGVSGLEGATNLLMRNGTVRGWRNGITGPSGSRYENIRAFGDA